jgi:phage terminase large subunit
VNFTKTSNDRETGWLAIKELLCDTGQGSALKIFSNCRELIKCLPALTVDPLRPTDTRTEPHDITHAPDALRAFAIFHTRPNETKNKARLVPWSHDMWEDYDAASDEEKNYLKRKYGEPM